MDAPALLIESTRSRWPEFGVLTSRQRDCSYPLGNDGFLYTSAWVNTRATMRHTAVLLLSASGLPFEVAVGGRSIKAAAVYVPPLCQRDLHAFDVGLVSVNLTPHHRAYAPLRRKAGAWPRALERSAFAMFDPCLLDCYQGRLDLTQARTLFDALVERLLGQFGCAAQPQPTSAERIWRSIDSLPDYDLGALAERLHLSYDRASHRVAQDLGLSFKAYVSWRKSTEAWDHMRAGANLTQAAIAAGYTDSAHFSRTWRRKMGMAPSYLKNDNCVQVVR
jgi:AraC-like DNA-binding protein